MSSLDVQLIVVDTETSGLDPHIHEAVEVAWHNLATGERDSFVPVHDPRKILAAADLKALQVNRYIDRLATAPQDPDGPKRLFAAFGSRYKTERLTFAPDVPRIALGAVNPGFDAPFLTKLLRAAGPPGWHPAPWDYRMRNLADFAAGVFGLPLDQRLPSMHDICDLFGIEPGNHTAADDVRALAECFLALSEVRLAAGREQLALRLIEIQTARQKEQDDRAHAQ